MEVEGQRAENGLEHSLLKWVVGGDGCEEDSEPVGVPASTVKSVDPLDQFMQDASAEFLELVVAVIEDNRVERIVGVHSAHVFQERQLSVSLPTCF